MKLGDLIQSGDFKGEKHVPVIEAPSKIKAGEAFKVCLSVGKEKIGRASCRERV